uniref:Ribosomal protein S2 n=1 Tax=Acrobeloides nanus TaxID=290746 RepID=A0A914CC80_9BILA
MFMNRVHYGHRIGTLNENMKWALYGERLGVCIFDLEITRKYMVRALEFLAHMAARGAVILFVTADKTNMLMVEKMALSAGHYAHVRKWEPDTLDIKLKVGITARAPDLIVLLSVQNSLLGPHPAIYEAARKPIPTIGICDSNANPRMVTYPIPGNDDSPTAVHYYMTLFLEAIKRGEQNPMQNKHGEWVW